MASQTLRRTMAGGAPITPCDSDFPNKGTISDFPKSNYSYSSFRRRGAGTGAGWTIRNRPEARQGDNWVWKEKKRSDPDSSNSGRLKSAPLGSDGDGYSSSTKEMPSKVFKFSTGHAANLGETQEKVFCPVKLAMLARLETMLATIRRGKEVVDEWIEALDAGEKEELELETEKRERDMLERERNMLERARARDMKMNMVMDLERGRATDMEMQVNETEEDHASCDYLLDNPRPIQYDIARRVDGMVVSRDNIKFSPKCSDSIELGATRMSLGALQI